MIQFLKLYKNISVVFQLEIKKKQNHQLKTFLSRFKINS